MQIEKVRIGNEGSDYYYLKFEACGLTFACEDILIGEDADAKIAEINTVLKYDTGR